MPDVGVQFTRQSARRIANVVRRVEGTPDELGQGFESALPDRDEFTIGIRNGLGRALTRGECITVGAHATGDVFAAVVPTRQSDRIVIVTQQIADGATGRAWTAGARLANWSTRSDGYGGTLAVGMSLGPVCAGSNTYLIHSPHGEFEVVRIVSQPSGATPGTVLVRMLQPTREDWDTISEDGTDPKSVANVNIDTVSTGGGVKLALTDDGRGGWTLGLASA